MAWGLQFAAVVGYVGALNANLPTNFMRIQLLGSLPFLFSSLLVPFAVAQDAATAAP